MQIRTPIQVLAVQHFQGQYKDLLSIQAELHEFSRILIEYNADLMWKDNFTKNEYSDVEKTARSSYHFLLVGTHYEHKEVAISLLDSMQHLIFALNRCINSYVELKKLGILDYDNQIVGYLSFYKTLYEGLIPYIVAPIAFAFKVAYQIPNKLFISRGDGKVNLNVLKEMEKWLIHPQSRLAIGLNSHVRNSYSHETYRILDGGKVELRDVDPHRPNHSWGPEIWELDDLKRLCRSLWVNSFGIITGLIIFDINNRKIIRERNWYVDRSPKVVLRQNEIEMTVRRFAEDLSFNLGSVSLVNNQLNLTLKKMPRGIDQDEKIFFGGSQWSRAFKLSVRYEESLILIQVLRLLRKITQIAKGFNQIFVSVVDCENSIIGKLHTDCETVERSKSIEDDLGNFKKQFNLETLGDATMYVRIEGKPEAI